MGHVRLGRLPKTRRWREVVDLLATSPMDTPTVAQATVAAADVRLRELASDPSLVHSFWLLTRFRDRAGRLRPPGYAVRHRVHCAAHGRYPLVRAPPSRLRTIRGVGLTGSA